MLATDMRHLRAYARERDYQSAGSESRLGLKTNSPTAPPSNACRTTRPQSFRCQPVGGVLHTNSEGGQVDSDALPAMSAEGVIVATKRPLLRDANPRIDGGATHS